ncbi:TonB-dependent receptor [Brevundimonas sp.]|uniref:TonB-dependent receptor n=1 Tax=Brevundimonas sp. TaxID=1871086 RepID=UPI0025BAA07B|nr:TonB-dependent receptor [Brevundimonas sp.]
MDDIVVTARRREENLQDVPIAVTAFSAENLEARGYTSITDIQQSTPNLNFTPGTGGTSSQVSAFVRGVGEFDYIVTSDPAVAVFVDGVYQARPFAALTSLMGIERVEVLRGPQGSLFGKNTIGGAVNVVLARPTGSNTGSVDLRVGSYDSFQGRFSYDGAITDDLSFRVSGLGTVADGWQKLDSGGTLGDQNVVAGRAALRWRRGDLDATFTVDGLRQRQNSAAHSMIAFEPTFFSDLFSTFVGPCCTVPSSIDRTESTPELNIDNADALNTSLIIDLPAFGGDLKSISAVRYSDVEFARDADASVLNYTGDRQHIRSTQYSQEFQLSHDLFDGRVTSLLGVYGFFERSSQKTRLVTADGLYPRLIDAGFPPADAAGLDFNIDFDMRQKTQNVAVFGNATVRLTDALSVDIGARYTWEDKDFYQSAMRVYAGVPLIPGMASYTLDESWSNFSPKVTANYKINEDVSIYALASRGFRSGGFNGRPTSAAEVGAFDPEELTSYEVGMKSDWLDRRLRLNLSAFHNTYDNMQVTVQYPLPGGVGIIARTENAGKATIWGLEAEGRLVATDWLTFDTSVGYLNGSYDEYLSQDAAGNPVDLSDLDLRHAPPLSASLGATFNWTVNSDIDASLRIDAAYQDRQFINAQNTPELEAEANTIVNASLRFAWRSGLSFSIDGQNLTDEQVIKEGFGAFGSFGFIEAYYNPPRRVFATIRYDF